MYSISIDCIEYRCMIHMWLVATALLLLCEIIDFLVFLFLYPRRSRAVEDLGVRAVAVAELSCTYTRIIALYYLFDTTGQT